MKIRPSRTTRRAAACNASMCAAPRGESVAAGSACAARVARRRRPLQRGALRSSKADREAGLRSAKIDGTLKICQTSCFPPAAAYDASICAARHGQFDETGCAYAARVVRTRAAGATSSEDRPRGRSSGSAGKRRTLKIRQSRSTLPAAACDTSMGAVLCGQFQETDGALTARRARKRRTSKLAASSSLAGAARGRTAQRECARRACRLFCNERAAPCAVSFDSPSHGESSKRRRKVDTRARRQRQSLRRAPSDRRLRRSTSCQGHDATSTPTATSRRYAVSSVRGRSGSLAAGWRLNSSTKGDLSIFAISSAEYLQLRARPRSTRSFTAIQGRRDSR